MLKFFLRLFINLIKFFLISLPLQLIGVIILLPVLGVMLLRPNVLQLPYCFRWFDCADWYIGRDTSTIFAVRNSGIWNSYVWLAWRNPINYFSYKYLGLNLSGYIKMTAFYKDPNAISEIGDGKGEIPGILYQEFLTESGTYYQYYALIRYPFCSYALRFRMGWKFEQGLNLPGYVQDVFNINPFYKLHVA